MELVSSSPVGAHTRARFWNCYEWALLLLCAALVAVQLFVPPSLGVADNNDFPKLMGRYCLGDPGAHPLFDYVSLTYRRAPSSCWDSGLLTSAVLPVDVGLLLARPFLPPGRFDLRWLGAVYALMFLAAFYAFQVLIRPLRPVPRLLLPLVALFLFAGAAYVPWFNSFYFDTASYVGLLLCAVAVCWLVFSPAVSAWEYLLTAALVLFFAMSKSQHAPLALWILPCFWLSFRRTRFPARWLRWLVTVVIAAGVVIMLVRVPREYSTINSYNALFYQALPRSAHPANDLRDLGLDRSLLQYVGKHAFLPDSPVQTPAQIDAFAAMLSPSKLALYFLSHPKTAVKALGYALREGSLQRVRMEIGSRQYRLGNYERSSGHPPESQSHFLTQWSDWKAAVFGNRPVRYAAYTIVLFAALWLLALRRPNPARPRIVLLMAVLTAMTGTALLIVLFDGVDTGRHLFLFNALLDVAVCAGVALI